MRWVLWMCALWIATASAAQAQPRDLGTLGGTYSVANGVNSSGVVVGTSRLADNVTYRAFRWQAGHMVDLGALPGMASSMAFGINRYGDIVGTSDRERAPGEEEGTTAAVVWRRGGPPRDLGRLHRHGSCQALAISDAGHIVGWCDVLGRQRAVLWTSTTMTDLGLLPGALGMEATSVNKYGDIVGRAALPDGSSRAFLWTPTRGLRDLGMPTGATWNWAAHVTNSRMIVGTALGRGGWRQFTTSRTFRVLRPLPNQGFTDARAGTDAGQIVGRSGDRAFLWIGGVMSELPRPRGWSRASAHAAVRTYAVGSATTAAGHTRAVLWVLP